MNHQFFLFTVRLYLAVTTLMCGITFAQVSDCDTWFGSGKMIDRSQDGITIQHGMFLSWYNGNTAVHIGDMRCF
jgi:hypothetical protein